MRIKVWITTITMLSLLIGAGTVCAKGLDPMATVKVKIDQVIAVLNDPQYNAPAKRDEQRKKIWEIASPLFDFPEISRRTVGPNWSRFSTEQKEHFVQVFTKLLGTIYIDRIQGEYHNEKIVYAKELVRSPYALVRTKLVRPNGSIPIDYRMKLENSQWKVYDILVESGVSIVQNYRVQFQSILQKESPNQLISRLENKLKEQKSSL
jgi:phospholipid transport system substrate-binding protein